MSLKNRSERAWAWLLEKSCFVLALGGVQFLVLSTIAMALYPGGTKYDPSTVGYSFWTNMLSDMGRTVAHDGTPNLPSSTLFIASMCILAATFVPFYVALSSRFTGDPKTRRHARMAALLGIITGALLASSASFPQDLFPQLHLRLAQFSFVVLVPSLLLYWHLVARDPSFPRPCAPAFLIFAIVIIAGIIVTIASGTGTDAMTVTIQATAQKVMVYSWNVSLPIEAWGLWRASSKERNPGKATG